jgi:predicted PurR-regulated permease PerM
MPTVELRLSPDDTSVPPNPSGMMPPADGGHSIRSVALTGLFILALLYTMHVGQVVFLPLTIAVMLSVLLAPIPRWLKRMHIPEPVSATFLLSIVVIGLGYGVTLLSEPATDWLEKAPHVFREAEYKLRVIKKPMQELNKAGELIATATALDEVKKVQKVEIHNGVWPARMFTITSELLLGGATMLILLFFLLSSGDLFLEKLVKILPTLQDKKRAVEIVREIESRLARYLMTVSGINLALGMTVGLSMHLLGMPNAFLWGVMAAVLTFIPYLGHMIGVCVVTLVAAVTFDDLGRILTVGGVYWALAVIEGTLVNPMIVGRRLELNPVIIVIGLMVWGWIWGIGGAFVAVPLMVAVKIFCDHIESLAPIGEFLSARGD